MTRPPPAVDPLQRARLAAEQALTDRLEAAGWPDPGKVAPVLAEIAVAVTWPHAEYAGRTARRDGR